MNNLKKLWRYIPAILWMGVIYYFSSLPTTGITGVQSIKEIGISIFIQRFIILKFFHLVEYSILGFFLYYAHQTVVTSLTIGYLYAISDELHQYFTPGRTPKISDTFIDLLGLSIGLFIFNFLTIRKSKTYK